MGTGDLIGVASWPNGLRGTGRRQMEESVLRSPLSRRCVVRVLETSAATGRVRLVSRVRVGRSTRAAGLGALGVLLTAVALALMAQGASASVAPYELSPFAGTGTAGAPSAGLATSSRLNNPVSLGLDSAGDVYIVDYNNNDVEKVTPSGVLSVIAGNGTAGAPTAGIATNSHLDGPFGVAVDGSGDVYIASDLDCEVVKVTPAGTLSIFAGDGTCGTPVAGTATSTSIGAPLGVAVDPSGNLYIADATEEAIEKVTPSGTLSIVAGIVGVSGAPTPGPATSSHLYSPQGVATDAAGNVYVANYDTYQVLEITSSGTLSVVAGTGSYGAPTAGPAASSALEGPYGVAVDGAGDVYIADYGSSTIDEVTPSHALSVIAGNGSFAAPTYGVAATSSALDGPEGVASTATGRVYIADTYNNTVELLAPPAVSAGTTPPAITGSTTVGQTLTASAGTWNNAPVLYAYQWEDCDATGANCVVISGATSSTYVTLASDTGHTIRVIVTATNGGGSVSQTSPPSSAIVAAVTPVPTPTPAPAPTPASPSLVPSNLYTVTGVTVESNGTIVVKVKVPAAGTIALLGTHEDVQPMREASALLWPGHQRFEWARANGEAAAAGTVAMTVHPDAAGKRLLARHRHYGWALHVTVWTTYTPAGGHPRSHKTIVKVLSARHSR
jgi:NHL repeat-containing protein